jgi:exosortase
MTRLENYKLRSGEKATVAGRRKQKPKAPVVVETPQPVETVAVVPFDRQRMIWSAVVLLAGAWAYGPTLMQIVHIWNTEPDYSHGFLVVPVAILFLWARRANYPGLSNPDYVLGLGLFGFSLLIRYLGALFYLEFIDGYSILPWLAGTVALIGGRRLLWWSMPSIAFLFFMIPLPFGIETAMSAPLQRIATKVTSYTLQTLGHTAFAEGNVILLGDQRLEIAQACSGLRLFVTIVAMAYAYVVLVKRTWWEKGILIASIVPIAIAANASRIVTTGLLFQYTSGETAHKFAHDFAGWAMIPLAAAMFGMVLCYLSLLIRQDEIMDMSVLVREVER